MRKLLITFFFLIPLLAPSLGGATPVWTDAAKAELQTATANSAVDGAKPTVSQLATLLNLQPLTEAPSTALRPPFAEGSPFKLVSIDLQLAMTQLSIHVGTNNQIRVLRAQGDRRDVLIVQSGFASLRDIAKSAELQGLDGLRMVNGVAVLTRPLIIWLGAGLKLEPGDNLQMNATSGAFLLGFGQIEMVGAQVDTSNVGSAPDAFRPFVLITGQGTLYAEDTSFSGLGMVGAEPFNGVTVAARGLFPPKFPPVLVHNAFDEIATIAMIGASKAVISDNLIKNGRAGGITLVGAQGADVVGNSVIGTKGGAGIKIANGTDVVLAGNLVSGGARNGVSIDSNSKSIKIVGNAILENAQTGIAAQRTTCVLVNGNSIAKNGAAGLRINESGTSRIQGNALILNTTAGVNVNAQQKGGRLEISDNLLVGNRSGLTGVAIGEVVLDQNNFTAQMPRLFDGEFSQYLPAYLTQVQQHSNQSYRIAAQDGAETAAFLTACNKG